MSKSVTDLPDYVTLRKLSAALWQQDNAYHGAAIMIGAGFSRSAASTGDIKAKLPLWNDLSETLAEGLGVSSSTYPLRLAEEYCAYFGTQALHDLVKSEINDAAWMPGELHKSLLELPWSEVLTTNWDTLLERAAIEVHQPVYNVVCRQEDLSSARSPRIVKLHGTVNVTEDLVFTQEDYRKYPQRHAAFVNFARQVFIENELCLLGFSGDDPNFLEWAGWVRDHLSIHARRIFLIGALNLTAAKRKYLESINVAPIDLGDLVTDYDDSDARHLAATRIFIQTLQNLKPKQAWEWQPTQLHRSTLSSTELDRTIHDSDYAARSLERQLTTLQADRLSYPAWLVCPTRQRWELQSQINDPYPTLQNLLAMEPDSRARLLYEIAWRHSVTYEATSPWLARELLTLCNPSTSCGLGKKQQMDVALLLLKNTRWFDDPEAKSIEQTTTCMLEREERYWVESSNELFFHQAIVSRDRFDYSKLEALANKITTSDPVWKLRKASLLADLGQFDEGEKLVADAYRELLGQYRKERNSIYLLSRLAWAHWLLRGIETWTPGKEFKPFPSIYQDPKCSPWDHIEQIRLRIFKVLEKQQEQQGIEPSFEPGRYKDNSNTVTFDSELHPLLLLEGISSSAGMPLRWNNVGFLVEHASRLVELDGIDCVHRFSLTIRAANSDTSDVLKKVFSRTRIACLLTEEADYLLNRCIEAVGYWSSKWSRQKGEERTYAIERLRIFMEVLARVSVRATPDRAKQVFRLASTIGNKPEFHHFLLFRSLRHLIDYALKSIPESQHHELLLEALSFPLQTEISVKDHEEWPNPVISSPGCRGENTALDRRIDEIIDSIAPCSSLSAPALIRLLPLIRKGYLTDAERRKVSEKIWGVLPDYQALPETGLLRYVLLDLPSQDSHAVKGLVRRYLFENRDNSLFDSSLLTDISNAARAKSIAELPSEDQALDYFRRMIAWRPKNADKDLFGLSEQLERQIGGRIGEALANSIIPALPTKELSEKRFDELFAFYTEVESPEAIVAFPYFAAANDLFVERVERIVRQGLQGQDPKKVSHSSYALLMWRDLNDSRDTARLISRLVHLIGSRRMTGLPALLWTANQMCNRGYLSEGDIELLVEVLPLIFDSADYRNISPYGRDAVSVSLVRAACVRLARDVVDVSEDEDGELLRVLEEARSDALPEVRFADPGKT